MQITTDFHSHVAGSSASQMVQSAQKKGLRVLGLSEHVFQMKEARGPLMHMQLEGPVLTFADYIEAVQNAGNGTQVDVRLGLEVDFIPAKNEQIQASLQGFPWDFLIGSVHEIDGQLIERGEEPSREECEHRWLHYFQLLRAAVSSGYFSLVSHPVRLRVTTPHLPATFDDELEYLAAEATQHDVALEINGYDMLTYPDLVRRLARACAIQNTPVSVSSDAHRPPQIAQGHQQSENLLREVGIRKVRIWKQRVAEEYTI